jgi:hypothetical protein
MVHIEKASSMEKMTKNQTNSMMVIYLWMMLNWYMFHFHQYCESLSVEAASSLIYWCVLYKRDNCLYRDLRSNWFCCITQYSIMLIYMDDVYHVIWLWSRLFWWYQLFIFSLSRLHFSCLSMFIHYLVIMWFCLHPYFIYDIFGLYHIHDDACFSLMVLNNTWTDVCNMSTMQW